MGTVLASPGKGQKVELKLMRWRCWDGRMSSYPLQKKRHTFEFLQGCSHLRPRTNTFGAVARVRNALSMAIHAFFQERGFIYIHLPS
jgi:asparaginyl-tRNA synthetase